MGKKTEVSVRVIRHLQTRWEDLQKKKRLQDDDADSFYGKPEEVTKKKRSNQSSAGEGEATLFNVCVFFSLCLCLLLLWVRLSGPPSSGSFVGTSCTLRSMPRYSMVQYVPEKELILTQYITQIPIASFLLGHTVRTVLTRIVGYTPYVPEKKWFSLNICSCQCLLEHPVVTRMPRYMVQ